MRNSKKVPGYIRAGSRYVSQTFLIGILVAVFAFGMLYMTVFHTEVMRIWYTYQKLPEFEIDSPYLAGYTGRVRLLQTNGTLLYEGQIDAAVISGNGKLYRNGVLLYEGSFLDNKYSGQGMLYATDGTVEYTGGFAENLFQGTGTLCYTDGGRQYKYIGEFEAGERDGRGNLYCEDRLVYTGEFAAGVFEGFGKQYGEGFMIYQGVFAAGLYEGEGKLYSENRLVYEGTFKEGLKDGAGREYSEGILMYDGAFALGTYEGKGFLYDETGCLIYAGGFSGGLYEGSGIEYEDKKICYEGDFQKGLYDGSGKLYDDAGKLLYEGGFSKGLYESEGKLYSDGSLVYEGGMSGGLHNGDGTEYNPDTGYPVFQGRYRDGRRMEAGVEFDENGVPVIVPVKRLNPLTLLNEAYDDVLTALTKDGTAYKEQVLEEQILVIDDTSGIIYIFSPDEEDMTERLDEIYLCGLAAAGGLVVGSDIGEEYDEPLADAGQAGIFALKLSDMYWGRETQEPALGQLEFESGSYVITAVYEQGEEQGGRIVYLKVGFAEIPEMPVEK